MKKYNKIYYRIIFVTMCFVLSSVFMLISGAESLAKSKGIKLRYNVSNLPEQKSFKKILPGSCHQEKLYGFLC